MAATYSSLIGLAVGGKYEIRRVLGSGGMGVVCEAIHLDLGKRVAIKLIDTTIKESELIVTRFRREARAAGQINSEHIVDVFDVGADPRVGLYMVMEYLIGEDLHERLEREERIDVKTAVMIAHQIARGLAKAHEVGIIHRDLKPANVYLTERDNGQMLVKLLDFGVSKVLSEAPDSARITGKGTAIGTALYMSPEQAEGKEDVDGRADIWSLGAVMYEALSGRPPFPDRGSYHGTIVGILTSRPKLLHDAAPWVPPELASVVDAMLVHDRDARIANIATVRERLLETFPAVLPDGTGKHTAVIIAQAAAAVNATGDTEVFTSASITHARASRPSFPGSAPELHDGGRTSRPPRSEQESRRTVPSDSTQTGAATAIDFSATQNPTSVVPSSGGPKTAPLPLSSNAESSSRAPTSTVQEADQLALGAERRPALTLVSIVLAIVGVAVGGFLVGRHAAPDVIAGSSPAQTASPVMSARVAAVSTTAVTDAPPPRPNTSASGARTSQANQPVPKKLGRSAEELGELGR